MNTVILTTETPHHVQFVDAVARSFPIAAVFAETRTLRPAFDTAHPLEAQRDAHERDAWFDGKPRTLADAAPVLRTVESMNDAAACRQLHDLRPDVVITFGTGRLAPAVIAPWANRIVNLHGGDPEEYRGLDSHLWAIYHRDFGGLVTTLHMLNAELDDGAAVLQAPIPLHRGMKLHHLRRHNTEVCIDLALSGLDMMRRHGRFLARPQRRVGRYYSFMPTALKDLCVRRFEAFTERLP